MTRPDSKYREEVLGCPLRAPKNNPAPRASYTLVILQPVWCTWGYSRFCWCTSRLRVMMPSSGETALAYGVATIEQLYQKLALRYGAHAPLRAVRYAAHLVGENLFTFYLMERGLSYNKLRSENKAAPAPPCPACWAVSLLDARVARR